jgi:hypothetical protein
MSVSNFSDKSNGVQMLLKYCRNRAEILSKSC